MKLFFIRHGETDWHALEARGVRGWARSFAPLTQLGRMQISVIANDYRLEEAEGILCSSYARALESAGILSRSLNQPFYVEYDLHEWLPQKDPLGDVDEQIQQEANKQLSYYTGFIPFADRRMNREGSTPQVDRRTPVRERGSAAARSPQLGERRRGARARLERLEPLSAHANPHRRLARGGDYQYVRAAASD